MDVPRKIVGFSGDAAPPDGRRVLPARFVLRLQQTVGNREVVRLLVPRPVPPTALVLSPSRPLERPRSPTRRARLAALWRRLWRRPT